MLSNTRGWNLMEKIRVVLANCPQMIGDFEIRKLIDTQKDMEVVGELLGQVNVLMDIRKIKADAVILALQDYEEPGLYSHLVAEYPNLTILGLAPDGRTALIRPRRQEIVHPSGANILSTLRHAVRAPCNWEKEMDKGYLQ